MKIITFPHIKFRFEDRPNYPVISFIGNLINMTHIDTNGLNSLVFALYPFSQQNLINQWISRGFNKV